MSKTRIFGAITALALMGACTNVGTTRNIPLETLPVDTVGVKSSQSVSWHVEDVRVAVPESLTVSEANLYLPKADIVWREDPHGDRRLQVKNIVDMAVSQATLGMTGSEAVYLDIEIKRFHALSQKARATVGGRHTIDFVVGIRDVETDVALVDPFPVHIKLKALGGQKAIDAEIRGETQKVRITREITNVMRQYLGM